MTLLAFLYAIMFQMSGTELQGNAWGVRVLQLTYANLQAVQGFFGWVALAMVILIVVIVGISVVFGGKGFEAAFTASGCFGFVAVASFIIWLAGLLQVLAVGYLVANFTLAGAVSPGFWVVLVILILASWS